METKRIPALIMLLGCSVAAVMSYVNHYSLEKMLKTILVAYDVQVRALPV